MQHYHASLVSVLNQKGWSDMAVTSFVGEFAENLSVDTRGPKVTHNQMQASADILQLSCEQKVHAWKGKLTAHTVATAKA